MGSLKLGVNLDHVATLRQARYIDNTINSEPDLINSVKQAVKGGADSITLHSVSYTHLTLPTKA